MFTLTIKCPLCGGSLMDAEHRIENHPSVKLAARVGEEEGVINISNIYGSLEAESSLTVPEGTEVLFSCWQCNMPFPAEGSCSSCQASIIILDLADGPSIKICSRRGCLNHAIRFGEWKDVPVSSIMRRGLVTVAPDTPLKQIVKILVNTDLNTLPVVEENGDLLGEVSLFQLMTHLIPQEVGTIDHVSYRRLLHCYADWDTLTVGDLMTVQTPTIHPGGKLEEAVAIFRKSCRPSLFVVEEKRILGCLNVADLCKALIEKRKEETGRA